MISAYYRQVSFLDLTLMLLLTLGVFGLVLSSPVSAAPPPPEAQAVMIANCPPPGSTGQTIHYLYPETGTVVSATSRVTLNLFAASHVCSSAPYAQASNIRITIVAPLPTDANGTVEIGGGFTYFIGDVLRSNFSDAQSRPLTVDLNPGLNVFCFNYQADARYGSTLDISIIGNQCIYIQYVPPPPPPPPEFQLESSILPAALQVEPGGSYTFMARLRNLREGASPTAVLRVQNQNSTAILFAGQSGPNHPAGIAQGYGNGPNCDSGAAVSRSPCWWWRYSSINRNGTADDQAYVSFTFTVASTAPDGTACFQAFASPETWTDTEHVGNRFCVRIVSPRQPFLTTEGGDVHAGSGWDDRPCLMPGQPAQTIRGTRNGSRGSKGDFIVSAGGSITGFGSAGSPSANNLTFGSIPGGSYGQICRPDLAAQYLSDPSLPVFPAMIANPTTLASAFDGRIVRAGGFSGNLTINGGSINIGQQVTVLVNGNVYINGNIDYAPSGYNSRRDIPSFAVIATGNIYIDPSVTRLYGMYYAGTQGRRGSIDTCRANGSLIPINFIPGGPIITAPGGAAACGQALRLTGALIATDFAFRRTYGDVDTGTAAEIIDHFSGLLLNTPPGFSVLTPQLRSQTERPPVL